MTSIPASRRARATTLAPWSCPSRPGFATTTRMRSAIATLHTKRSDSTAPRRIADHRKTIAILHLTVHDHHAESGGHGVHVRYPITADRRPPGSQVADAAPRPPLIALERRIQLGLTESRLNYVDHRARAGAERRRSVAA